MADNMGSGKERITVWMKVAEENMDEGCLSLYSLFCNCGEYAIDLYLESYVKQTEWKVFFDRQKRASDRICFITNQKGKEKALLRFAEQSVKMLYLAPGMVVCRSVERLVDIDMEGCSIAAPQLIWNPNRRFFAEHYMGEKEMPLVSVDVMWLDVPLVLKKRELLEDYIRRRGDFKSVWPEAVHQIYKNEIYILPLEWNVEFGILETNYRNEIIDVEESGYREIIRNPVIMNYTGGKKPWNHPDLEGAQYFLDLIDKIDATEGTGYRLKYAKTKK